MIELMRFWFFSGFLLAGTAWSVDTLLRGKGIQLRGVWAAAMGLTVLSPVLPRIGSFGGGIDTAEPFLAGVPAAEMDALAQLATPLQAVLLDGVVLAAWAIISMALAAFGATVLFRLNRRAGTWRTAKVRGEEVLVAPDFGPAVVGLAKPAIVLPEELYLTRGSDLDLVLRHEREHVVARDPWLLLAGAAAVACMPWNLPLVWQATRLRAAVEEDCDIRVLRSGACRRRYGDLLVRMASRPSGFGFAAAAMSERRSGLRRRLERLRDQQGQTRVAVTALLVIAGAGAIGVWMGMPSPVSHFHLRSGGPVHLPGVVELPPPPEVPALAPLREPSWASEERLQELAEARLHLERAVKELAQVEREHPVMTSEERLELNAERLARMSELKRAEFAFQQLLARQRQLMFDENYERSGMRVRSRAPTAEGDGEHSFRVSPDVWGEMASTELKPIIYVNGEPFPGELADINPENIVRVEVVKGEAARKLHGGPAAGGIVNIYLKTDGTGSN